MNDVNSRRLQGSVPKAAIQQYVSGPVVLLDLSYTDIAPIAAALGLAFANEDIINFQRYGSPAALQQTPLNYWPLGGVVRAISAMDSTSQASVKLLSGHFSARIREVLPPTRLMATVIRNPVDRILDSYASHAQSMKMSLVQAIESQRAGWEGSAFVNDYQARSLSADPVLDPDLGGARISPVADVAQIIRDFDENYILVGVTERLEDTAIALARQLGLPLTVFAGLVANTGAQNLRSSVPADILRQLESLNRADMQLFAYANAQLDARIAEDAAGFGNDRELLHELRRRHADGESLADVFGFETAQRGRLEPRMRYGNSQAAQAQPSSMLDLNRGAYLDLMEEILINRIYPDPSTAPWSKGRFNAPERSIGSDWPAIAHTMVGKKRINNVRQLSERVIINAVPGNFIETGVWRGGSTIMMRAVLHSYADTTRTVFVADSFSGVPKPDAKYAADAGDTHFEADQLAISQAEVAENFRRYGLLDRQVRFLPGLFKDTLPDAPIGQLALMRLDGDLYESTRDALLALYGKLSVGGYVIIDDYGAVPGCKTAVDEFREANGITQPLAQIDWAGVFWQKLVDQN